MSEEQLNKIARYLQEEMSEAELASFGKELEGNDELRQELNFKRLLSASIYDQQLGVFKKKFLAARPIPKENDKKIIPIWIRRFAAIAASVAAVVFAIWYFSDDDSNIANLNYVVVLHADSLNKIDLVTLPLKTLERGNASTLSDSVIAGVYQSKTLTNWQYKFHKTDGKLYFNVYLPASQPYQQGQLQGIYAWQKRYFLRLENQWFEVVRTDDTPAKELLPAKNDEVPPELPTQ